MDITGYKSARGSVLEAERRIEEDLAKARLPLFGVSRTIGVEVFLAAACFERGIQPLGRSARTASIAVVSEAVELAHERTDSGAFLSIEVADAPGGVDSTSMSNALSLLQAKRLKQRRRRAAELRYELDDAEAEELAVAQAAMRAAAELVGALTEPLPVGSLKVWLTGQWVEFAAVRMGDLLVARHLGAAYTLTIRSDGWPDIDRLALVPVEDSYHYCQGRRARLSS